MGKEDVQHQKPNLLLEAVEVGVAGDDDARVSDRRQPKVVAMVSKNSTVPNASYCAFVVRRITLINKKVLSIGESHGAAN